MLINEVGMSSTCHLVERIDIVILMTLILVLIWLLNFDEMTLLM